MDSVLFDLHPNIHSITKQECKLRKYKFYGTITTKVLDFNTINILEPEGRLSFVSMMRNVRDELVTKLDVENNYYYIYFDVKIENHNLYFNFSVFTL